MKVNSSWQRLSRSKTKKILASDCWNKGKRKSRICKIATSWPFRNGDPLKNHWFLIRKRNNPKNKSRHSADAKKMRLIKLLSFINCVRPIMHIFQQHITLTQPTKPQNKYTGIKQLILLYFIGATLESSWGLEFGLPEQAAPRNFAVWLPFWPLLRCLMDWLVGVAHGSGLKAPTDGLWKKASAGCSGPSLGWWASPLPIAELRASCWAPRWWPTSLSPTCNSAI